MVEKQLLRYNERMYNLTGGVVASMAQRDKLVYWINSQGVPTPGVTKQDINDLLARDLPENVREVCEIRQQASKTSTAKLKKMLEAVCDDGRVRGCLQYYGASRTGRWAGRLIQIQNFARGIFKEVYQVETAIKAIQTDTVDLFYDDVMTVISSTLRSMIKAPEGYKLIVTDLSGIEARVLAWLAGDEKTLDVFRRDICVYKYTAARMLSIPSVADVTEEERFLGKVACIAEGQLVLTDIGLVPIESIQLHHKVWDGQQWVSHEGLVYQGEKEVMTYEGLTATKDHIVFTEDGREISIRDAAEEQVKLKRTGAGRESIRMGGSNLSTCGVGRRIRQKRTSEQAEDAYCPMYKLSNSEKNKHEKPTLRKDERMPVLLSAKKNTQVARPQGYCNEREMRKREGSKLPQIRRERNRVQVRECAGSWLVDTRESRATQRFADRQDRQQRSLRERESQVGYHHAASTKQGGYEVTKGLGVQRGGMAIREAYGREKVKKWANKGGNNRRSETGCVRKEQAVDGHKRKVRVYDILNCGPNHRFTVSGVLVHNCLALGYQGGKAAFISMGKNYNADIDEPTAEKTVREWRESNSKIVALWGVVERAIVEQLQAPAQTTAKVKFNKVTEHISVAHHKKHLYIKLPSGRLLAYVEPRLINNKITVKGVNQFTRKWEDTDFYGGKFVENICQAVARDVFAAAFSKAEAAGYPLIAHVHDELITEVPDSEEYTLDTLNQLLCDNPPWAKGLPLNAKGAVLYRYMK